ncbi:hypothetical protein TNCV_265291 [Trichonephila clavipes]|nr:hypothetical protein TNCV_265291 [Trichonephila clavipes]
MVLKATTNNLALCHDELRGPRSGRCRSATRGLLAKDHEILNHGQVTWTTPELHPSPNYHTNGRTFQLSTDLACIAALHGGSLWYWARTRDKAIHDPIPIPLGYRGHKEGKRGPGSKVTITVP